MDDSDEGQDRRRADQTGDDPLFEPVEQEIEQPPYPHSSIPRLLEEELSGSQDCGGVNPEAL